MMILINGGSSSGKSAFAETLIVEQAKKEEVMAEATGKIDARRRPENGYAPSAVLLPCNHDRLGRGVQGTDPKTPQNAGKKRIL